ncbi:hypothetical protein BOTBODRAFT_521492 [Botryobasidium botryosum FD-172 SS1]|uniref:Uncharacterized protein n=1 Tax=Botryobasidium botryosum (strain FD-172 SS1) TaxID=930990 RepID=A0A067M4Y3_BOTB1|nr:hypothetical protein BOTBODRAFT_521492 [Botryobasidium botryosum FD-172 SS1]
MPITMRMPLLKEISLCLILAAFSADHADSADTDCLPVSTVRRRFGRVIYDRKEPGCCIQSSPNLAAQIYGLKLPPSWYEPSNCCTPSVLSLR